MLKSRLSPKFRVILFLLLLNSTWIVAANAGLDRNQWLWITPLALSINFLLLTYDHLLQFSNFKARPIVGQDPWGLLKVIHQKARDLKVEPPAVFLIEHAGAHIFSYAKIRKHSRLFLTSGLLQLLKPEEMDAVLTYQLIAIQSRHTFLNYWLGAAADLISRVAFGVEKLFGFLFGWNPQIKSWIVGPWIWILRLFLISPRDYQKLDSQTALKISNPEALARALWKMEAYAKTQSWSDSLVFAHMCMVNPYNFGLLGPFLTAQPSLKSRVKHLVGRYPL